LIQIGLKTAEKTLHKQTDRQTDIHYENNGHLAVNQKLKHVTLLSSTFCCILWCCRSWVWSFFDSCTANAAVPACAV